MLTFELQELQVLCGVGVQGIKTEEYVVMLCDNSLKPNKYIFKRLDFKDLFQSKNYFCILIKKDKHVKSDDETYY